MHVVGPAINLNSGGSAGSGAGYGGQTAIAPKVSAALQTPAAGLAPDIAASLTGMSPNVIPSTPTLIQQVVHDLNQGTPITQTCQKQPDGSCPLSDCPCGNNA
ncbi:hypothetical protein P4S72_06750 [Vibrio sp. PP-XX7]